MAEFNTSIRDEIEKDRKNPGVEFEPFEFTLICPGCNRPLPLYVQPLHQITPINCPRCSRSLSAMIKREIRDRLKG